MGQSLAWFRHHKLTCFSCVDLYFALRSGDEQRHLHFSSISLVEKPGCVPCLVYTEAASKNNLGRLKD